MPDSSREIRQGIEELARNAGFDAVGFTPATMGEREKLRLRQFVENGEYGDMGWMEETLERRISPTNLWSDARSVVVLAANYGPAENPLGILDHPDRAAISVYAKNRDYHDLIKKRLKQVARAMVEKWQCEVKVFVDTAPAMEKPLASLAGLGWQGKHTNLVSREFGSWLFLGEIFTTLDLNGTSADISPDEVTPARDRCGSCTNCLDICPTKAFPAPYRLDARRCISYLTIEHKGPIPMEFREALGNRIYGCDDCLAVCPWNKFAERSREAAFMPRAELSAPRLADFLDFDDTGFREFFSGSPIKRIGRDRFLRNVLIALGNAGRANTAERIIPLLNDPSPLVRGAAIWALGRLQSSETLETLHHEHAPEETDPEVLAEWQAVISDRGTG